VKRSTDRYLTTHVGSLIRPPEIVDFQRKITADEPIDEASYEAALKRDVAEVVSRQAEAGVDIVSDGEYGKSAWMGYGLSRMTGFEMREVPRPRVGFRGWDAEGRFKEFYDRSMPGSVGSLNARQMVCTGPIEYTDEGRRQMRRDVENFKAALEGAAVEEAFLPVVAPCSVFINYANEYYKDDEEFLFALADAQHEEYQIIVDAGLIVQVDDAVLMNLHDPIVDAGIDFRGWVDMNIAALNHALEGIPEDRVRYHLCWGSWPGPHTTDPPLSEFVDLLLKINAQGFSIEAANPRHEWEWVVWQDTKLPDGKILIPGMVSHATAHVEHPELVAQRIKRFADLVGPENVIASTDCGFAQNSGIQRQHPEIQWAKLEALAEGARLATERR
jgi:5-methyltetrahydropteroyltriglutamate--homocysteine methyltransferase